MQIEITSPIAKAQFSKIRHQTERICKSLKPEDTSIQPIDFVSPPKWHLAHTTWFFEQFVLTEHKENYKVFNPDFAYYFNSYYNNIGERVLRANRGLMTRPTLKEVLEAGSNAYPVLNCTKIELKNIGKNNIEISTTGFNNLMLWTEVNTMICIEPITQYTSYVEQEYLNKHMQLSQGKNIFTVEIKVI